MHSGYSQITPQCNYKNNNSLHPHTLFSKKTSLTSVSLQLYLHPPTQLTMMLLFYLLTSHYRGRGFPSLASPAPPNTYPSRPPASQQSYMITVARTVFSICIMTILWILSVAECGKLWLLFLPFLHILFPEWLSCFSVCQVLYEVMTDSTPCPLPRHFC